MMKGICVLAAVLCALISVESTETSIKTVK